MMRRMFSLFALLVVSAFFSSCAQPHKQFQGNNLLRTWKYISLPNTSLQLLLPESAVLQNNVVYSQPIEAIDFRDHFFAFRYSQKNASTLEELKEGACGLSTNGTISNKEALDGNIVFGHIDCGHGEAMRFLFTQEMAVIFVNSTDESDLGMKLYEAALKSARHKSSF